MYTRIALTETQADLLVDLAEEVLPLTAGDWDAIAEDLLVLEEAGLAWCDYDGECGTTEAGIEFSDVLCGYEREGIVFGREGEYFAFYV